MSQLVTHETESNPICNQKANTDIFASTYKMVSVITNFKTNLKKKKEKPSYNLKDFFSVFGF